MELSFVMYEVQGNLINVVLIFEEFQLITVGSIFDKRLLICISSFWCS